MHLAYDPAILILGIQWIQITLYTNIHSIIGSNRNKPKPSSGKLINSGIFKQQITSQQLKRTNHWYT